MQAEIPPSAETLREVFAPVGESMSLPGYLYTSEDVFRWEVDHFFDRTWACVGRTGDSLRPGERTATRSGSEGIVLSRDEAGTLHGFFNVCRHRGHELLQIGESASGKTIECPYHGWAYGQDGRLRGAPGFRGLDRDEFGLSRVRVAEWRGWGFVNVSGDAPELEDHIGNLDEVVRDYEPERLTNVVSVDYEIHANWKLIHDNYQECYHCSNIHPELCAVTPPESGFDYEPTGVWIGGSMELRPHAVTMSLDGHSDASPFRGLDERKRREVLYFGVLPNLLISLHPDYLVSYRVTPVAPNRTSIECRWLFSPEDADREGFDPAFAVDFWDLTNKQDWDAIQSVQRGMSSRGHRPGRLSASESTVREFETMLARGYLTGSLQPKTADAPLVPDGS